LTVELDCTGMAPVSGTVNGVTDTTIDVTLGVSLPSDLICQVIVTNADGSSFTYSSISTKNSSGNLATFQTSSAAGLTPRRALALVAARPTATSRFLYAMGGDDGTFLGAMDSVQSIGVGVDGQLIGDWVDQPPQGQLPEARTNAGFTRIGRFIYLTGGHDGTVDAGMGETNGAVSTVYRAQVLDPLDTPEIADLDIALGDEAGTTGLDAGLWQYRVAAVFPGSDPSNPDGESIGGELLNVQIPDLGISQKLELIVRWSAIAGASGYRVYRSPAVVDPSGPGTLELLFDLDCSTPATPNLDNCTCTPTLSCRDAGETTDDSQSPLVVGALGAWHEVLPLTTEREGHFTTAVKHPNASLTSTGGTPAENYETWVLYAAGGRDNGSPSINYLDDYEWVAVRVYEDGHQELQDPGGGSWTTVASSIGTGRADLAGWVLTSTDSSFIPANTVYVAIGTGFDDVTSTIADVRAGYLDASSSDGELEAVDAAPELDAWTGNESRAGACFGDAGGRVYLFGGKNSSGGFQGDVASALRSGPDTSPSWSAGGGGVLSPRRNYCAAAQESAFFFIAGGEVEGVGVSGTVQTTVQ
jgi:hypothetical protein